MFFNDHTTTIMVDNTLGEWAGIPYAELSLLLVHLKFLYHLHQNHHWISKGDAFYGNHLMFQPLYEKTLGEIDSLAEKAIGLGSDANVDFQRIMLGLTKLSQKSQGLSTIPNSNQLVERSLQSEKEFLSTVSNCVTSLKEKNVLTRGLDNLIADIEDTHESHVYLLKRALEK